MLAYFSLTPPMLSQDAMTFINIAITLLMIAYFAYSVVAITEYTNNKQKASLGRLDLQFFYAECMMVLRYQREDSEYYMRTKGYIPAIITTRFQRWLREKTSDTLQCIGKSYGKKTQAIGKYKGRLFTWWSTSLPYNMHHHKTMVSNLNV